jgi:twitching motility protein PilT
MLASALKGVVAQNLLKKKGGGRVAALEVLVCNAAVAALIRDAKTSQIMSIMQTAKKEGMTLLNEELARFVKDDVIEPMEAYYKAVDKDGLVKSFESSGVQFTPPAD